MYYPPSVPAHWLTNRMTKPTTAFIFNQTPIFDAFKKLELLDYFWRPLIQFFTQNMIEKFKKKSISFFPRRHVVSPNHSKIYNYVAKRSISDREKSKLIMKLTRSSCISSLLQTHELIRWKANKKKTAFNHFQGSRNFALCHTLHLLWIGDGFAQILTPSNISWEVDVLETWQLLMPWTTDSPGMFHWAEQICWRLCDNSNIFAMIGIFKWLRWGLARSLLCFLLMWNNI